VFGPPWVEARYSGNGTLASLTRMIDGHMQARSAACKGPHLIADSVLIDFDAQIVALPQIAGGDARATSTYLACA